MLHPTGVILVVGLTEKLLAHMPRTGAFAKAGRVRTLRPVFPAVTCPVQSSMLTGLPVSGHGVVANGWYNREQSELQFWKQSNRLVSGEKVWETARKRDASVTTANICWWFNMYSGAEYSVTPRPMYTADGRKIPDCYTRPGDLRDRLQSELGAFPLFRFWGPGASIESSRWIAEAVKRTAGWYSPTLMLAYLPHLDYALQKFGPAGPEAVAAAGQIDEVIGDLLEFMRSRGVRPMIVSEYGIEQVDRPVFPNRVLREAGFMSVREERGGELLDAGASRAFAVCDHQSAQVYVQDPADIASIADVLRSTPGVERVLDAGGQQELGVRHERSGELVLVAKKGAWFAYPYWLSDARAPDFARTVEIHRKPGYDPCELFLDPTMRLPAFTVGRKVLARKLGFRTLLDIVPLDATIVKGSHGRLDNAPKERPVLITQGEGTSGGGADEIACEAVRGAVLDHVFEPEGV